MKLHVVILQLIVVPALCLALEGCRRKDTSSPQVSRAAADDPAETDGSVTEDNSPQTGAEEPADNPSGAAPDESASSNDSTGNQGSDPATGAPSGGGRPSGAQTPNSGSASPSGVAGGDGPAAWGAPPRFATPEKALQFATQKRREAQRSAKKGAKPEAYSATLEAWQALQPHLENSSCDQMSAYLLAELEDYGEQLGSHGVIIRGKPLKIK